MRSFVAGVRALGITPHVAANNTRSAVDGRTTRHAGYAVSQHKRKLVEQVFGWMKTIGGLAQAPAPRRGAGGCDCDVCRGGLQPGPHADAGGEAGVNARTTRTGVSERPTWRHAHEHRPAGASHFFISLLDSWSVDARTYCEPTTLWRLSREGTSAKAVVVPHWRVSTLVCWIGSEMEAAVDSPNLATLVGEAEQLRRELLGRGWVLHRRLAPATRCKAVGTVNLVHSVTPLDRTAGGI